MAEEMNLDLVTFVKYDEQTEKCTMEVVRLLPTVAIPTGVVFAGTFERRAFIKK